MNQKSKLLYPVTNAINPSAAAVAVRKPCNFWVNYVPGYSAAIKKQNEPQRPFALCNRLAAIRPNANSIYISAGRIVSLGIFHAVAYTPDTNPCPFLFYFILFVPVVFSPLLACFDSSSRTAITLPTVHPFCMHIPSRIRRQFLFRRNIHMHLL